MDMSNDLRVSINDTTLMCPSHIPENKTVFLSNLDISRSHINVRLINFFTSNPDFPFEAVITRIKIAMQRLLNVPYGFAAGRLHTNPMTGRLEINCDNAGVGFVVASSPLSLDDLGDLEQPNASFGQLILSGEEKFVDDHDKQPAVFVAQVTAFKCGGFGMAFSINHVVTDGTGCRILLENFASQTFDSGKPILLMPSNDRNFLRARSPPQVSFPHLELNQLPVVGMSDNVQKNELKENPQKEESTKFDLKPSYETKLFTLSYKEINILKERVQVVEERAVNAGTNNVITTCFNVVAALIWKCRALSRENSDINKDHESMLLYSVDIRSRMKPQIPLSYFGNAIMTAYATATWAEIAEGPFNKIVRKVWEGKARITDEYVRSGIDLMETSNRHSNGEVWITSWWRLGIEGVVYPWGKPKNINVVDSLGNGIVVLFPASDGGVNIQISGTPNEMDKIKTLLHEYLNN